MKTRIKLSDSALVVRASQFNRAALDSFDSMNVTTYVLHDECMSALLGAAQPASSAKLDHCSNRKVASLLRSDL